MKKTPLYQNHVDMGAEMVDFHGWIMPIRYSSLVEEHQAVRNQAGVFDVSHMGEIRVRGKDAADFVNHVFTNQVDKLEVLQIAYGFFLNHRGGVVDDLLTYRFADQEFLFVVNASNLDKDLAWLKEQKGDFDVEIIDESPETAEIAIQGPQAQSILQRYTEYDLDQIKFFRLVPEIDIQGMPFMISRTGYTGEDGFEIYGSGEHIQKLWVTLFADEKELSPAGLGCRDTLRFEANLPLYGNELDDDTTPIEAGLGFFVSKEGNYIGSDVIREQREKGVARKQVGLEILGRGIARQGYPVLNEAGEEIGVVSTGYASPTLGKTIANAFVKPEYAKLGQKLQVGIRKKVVEAEVISKKYLQKK